jgi:hypothetical protein
LSRAHAEIVVGHVARSSHALTVQIFRHLGLTLDQRSRASAISIGSAWLLTGALDDDDGVVDRDDVLVA